jgi:hypothetical protein
MLPLSGLLFVRQRDRAQVFHHAHAKRRSRQRLTKYTDALLIRGDMPREGMLRYMPRLGPKIGRTLARAWRRIMRLR